MTFYKAVVIVTVLAVLVAFFRPLMRLLLKGTVQWGLKDVGARALAKQPDAIHLSPRQGHIWRNPALMEAYRSGLTGLGFSTAGVYAVDGMPGVVMEFLLNAKDGFYAVIYDHPQAGVWLNLITLYHDGTSITFTTAADRGLEQRPGHPVVHQTGASAEVVYQWAMAERPRGTFKPVNATSIVGEFERAYAEGLNWRRQKGISAQEVAKVIKTRSAAPGPQVRVVPEIEFLKDQDGAPERELKDSLSKLLQGWTSVDRAYLAAIRSPKSNKESVALCLVSKAGPDQALVGAVRGVFGAQFRTGAALDIVFLRQDQEAQAAKACHPFFQRS